MWGSIDLAMIGYDYSHGKRHIQTQILAILDGLSHNNFERDQLGRLTVNNTWATNQSWRRYISINILTLQNNTHPLVPLGLKQRRHSHVRPQAQSSELTFIAHSLVACGVCSAFIPRYLGCWIWTFIALSCKASLWTKILLVCNSVICESVRTQPNR